MSNEYQPTCYACGEPATRVKQQNDLGVIGSVVHVCNAPGCQPDRPGERPWVSLPLTIEEVARDFDAARAARKNA